MNTALWVLASVLSLAFVVGGGSLLLLGRAKYRAMAASQQWVDDFGDGHLKVIGAIKVLGGVGLTLPALLNIAPVLVPLAASGLMLLMAGAGTTRFRRSEWVSFGGDLVFVALFAFVAWGRFALEPFA